MSSEVLHIDLFVLFLIMQFCAVAYCWRGFVKDMEVSNKRRGGAGLNRDQDNLHNHSESRPKLPGKFLTKHKGGNWL